jgi:hypothetical protein
VTDPTPSPAAPDYRTGTLWGVLCLLLILGTVASALVIWAISNAVVTGDYVFDGAVMLGGAFAAIFFFLLLSGILYRVDHLRGVAHRRVMLFE